MARMLARASACLGLLAFAAEALPWDKKKEEGAKPVAPAVKSPPPPAVDPNFPIMMENAVKVAAQIDAIDKPSIFFGSCAMLLAFYAFGNMLIPSSVNNRDRRKSWLVTFASSVVMSATGLYFAFRLFATKGTILLPDLVEQDSLHAGTDATFANAICLFFLAYCVTDMILGTFAYPEQVIRKPTHSFYHLIERVVSSLAR